jgi:Protein of unknown function (DUF2948)
VLLDMDALKLFALDEKDLEVISACVQDSILKTGEIGYDVKRKRLVLPVNRFVWEREPRAKGQPAERRRAVLHFDRVISVKSSGLDRSKPATVLSLLALRFLPDDAPSGKLELLFADGISVLLDVECLEAQLADIGGRWAAQAKPKHGV